MRRTLVLLLAAAGVLSSSCAPEVMGPGTPECADSAGAEIATATIIQLQALPEAEWGPCIAELKVGWKYQDQFAESGRTVFWLDSDRVGDRFIEVELAGSCAVGDAERVGNPKTGIERFIRVDEEPGALPLIVVPVASRHVGDARALATRIAGTKMEGRVVTPFVDDADGSASERIERALRQAGIVVILDDFEIANDVVELRRTGHAPLVEVSLEEALEEIADDLGSPVYRAEWFHTFVGGCIVYRFDAKGAGSEFIALDIREALGFYPLGELREAARRAGFDV